MTGLLTLIITFSFVQGALKIAFAFEQTEFSVENNGWQNEDGYSGENRERNLLLEFGLEAKSITRDLSLYFDFYLSELSHDKKAWEGDPLFILLESNIFYLRRFLARQQEQVLSRSRKNHHTQYPIIIEQNSYLEMIYKLLKIITMFAHHFDGPLSEESDITDLVCVCLPNAVLKVRTEFERLFYAISFNDVFRGITGYNSIEEHPLSIAIEKLCSNYEDLIGSKESATDLQ